MLGVILISVYIEPKQKLFFHANEPERNGLIDCLKIAAPELFENILRQ